MDILGAIFFGLGTAVFFLQLLRPELVARLNMSRRSNAKQIFLVIVSGAFTVAFIAMMFEGNGHRHHSSQSAHGVSPFDISLDKTLDSSQSQLSTAQTKHLCRNLGSYAVSYARYKAGEDDDSVENVVSALAQAYPPALRKAVTDTWGLMQGIIDGQKANGSDLHDYIARNAGDGIPPGIAALYVGCQRVWQNNGLVATDSE